MGAKIGCDGTAIASPPRRSRIYPTSAMFSDEVGQARLRVGRGWGWVSVLVRVDAPHQTTTTPSPTLPHKGGGSHGLRYRGYFSAHARKRGRGRQALVIP